MTRAPVGAQRTALTTRRIEDALSSSPQLAGNDESKLARTQACASCVGVAGRASNTASFPRIATRSGPVCMRCVACRTGKAVDATRGSVRPR